ncbi:hypothetical protein H4R19_003594 [Coemansia spiralis]|nr:hypothetical protein H4R19_003594 [Coemansia spiralis]
MGRLAAADVAALAMLLACSQPATAGNDLGLLDAYAGGILGHFGLHNALTPRLAGSPAGGGAQDTAAEALTTLEPILPGAQTSGDSAGAPQCFSLRESRYCGGWFGEYAMSTLATVGGRNVASAAELDAAMDAYFGSSDEHSYINHFFGCQSWDGRLAPRYRVSYTCRSVLESQEAQDCNRNRPPPPPLCASSCAIYVQEWSALTSNHSMCVNNALAEDRRRSLASGCGVWPYNGTASCVASVESSAEVCGFLVSDVGEVSGAQSEADRLCAFCKGARSGCCLRPIVQLRCGEVSSRSTLLKGVTMAMALVLSAICLVVVWWFYRWAYVRTRRGRLRHCSAATSLASSMASGVTGGAHDSAARSPATGNSPASEPQRSSTNTSTSNNTTAAHSTDQAPAGRRSVATAIHARLLRLLGRQPLATGNDGHSGKRNTDPPARILGAQASMSTARRRALVELGIPPRPDAQTAEQPSLTDTLMSYLTIGSRGWSLASRLRGAGVAALEAAGPGSQHASSSASSRGSGGSPGQQLAPDIARNDSTCARSGSAAGDGDGDVLEVLYPYTSAESDELSITPGEQVRLLRMFSDGWAFVQRVDDGVVGAVPAVCLETSRSQPTT